MKKPVKRTSTSLTAVPAISSNIKKFRMQMENSDGKPMSQQECADKLGVVQQVWAAWESGKNNPNKTSQKKLAAFFGVEINELWQGKAPGTKAPGAEPITYDAVVNACLSVQAAISDVLLHLNRERDLKPFREDLKDLADTARSLQELLSDL